MGFAAYAAGPGGVTVKIHGHGVVIADQRLFKRGVCQPEIACGVDVTGGDASGFTGIVEQVKTLISMPL